MTSKQRRTLASISTEISKQRDRLQSLSGEVEDEEVTQELDKAADYLNESLYALAECEEVGAATLSK